MAGICKDYDVTLADPWSYTTRTSCRKERLKEGEQGRSRRLSVGSWKELSWSIYLIYIHQRDEYVHKTAVGPIQMHMLVVASRHADHTATEDALTTEPGCIQYRSGLCQ